MEVKGKCAMSSYQDIHSLGKNPARTEKQHRALWIMTQGVAFGLALGLMSRAAWDLGIVAAIALVFRDIGVATWIMLQDAADACWDFLQFISRQRIP